MKSRFATFSAFLICGISLVACGGSSDDGAGSLTAFSVLPSDVKFTAPTGATVCAGGPVATFFIYGGAPPYKINNPFPTAMLLDRTSVSTRGGSFNVSMTGGCLDPGSLIVVDDLGHTISVPVSYVLGSS